MKFYQKSAIIILIMLTSIFFAACGSADTGSDASTVDDTANTETQAIIVGAAASLQGALTELGDTYMAAHPGTDISFTFGSSGTVAKQIEEGAPVALFLSANTKYVNQLKDEDLLIADSCKNNLTNTLLLVAPTDGTCAGWDDLVNMNQISIGNPETAPVGKYAQETLENLGLWDGLQGKIVLAKDVSEVFTYVEQGAVDAGVVYYSDLVKAQNAAKKTGGELKVKEVAEAPDGSHSDIVYGIGLCKTDSQLAQDFYDYLFTDEAGQVFTAYGFTPIAE